MLSIPTHRLRQRSKGVRIACGASGFFLTACMIAGTVHGVGAVYREHHLVEDLKVHFPSHQLPPFPVGEEGEAVEAPQRFLLFVLLMPQDFGTGQWPVLAREFDLVWPRDRERIVGWSFQTADGVHAQSLRLEKSSLFDDTLDIELKGSSVAEGNLGGGSRSTISFSFSWSTPTQALAGMRSEDEVDWRVGLSSGWFTLVPQVVARRYSVQYVACRVAIDDPLREVSLSELLTESEGARVPEKFFSKSSSSMRRGWTPALDGGGWWLFAYIGRALLTVLATVLLLSQVFRVRALAFLWVLLVLVFLTIGLDRYAVGRHAILAADSGEAVETRALAIDALRASFFFRATAATATERVADDPAAPEVIRKKARDAARELRGG